MHLLVIRTSAMGDVALTTPVIRAFLNQYPGSRITLVTRESFRHFFTSTDNLTLFFPDFKNRHSGLTGVIRLFKDLRKQNKYDHVIDLHDVLRSKILRLFFKISGTPFLVIDKGRSEKKRLIKGKVRVQLKHSVERYSDVFSRAGLPVTIEPGPWIIPSSEAFDIEAGENGSSGVLNVGVAPYAKHSLKRWPEESMIRLLEMIRQKHRVKFWLFGGQEESDLLERIRSRVSDSQKVPCQSDLGAELALISRLDFMIAMDSSNMHMAALTGTKVISIWGGTDPLTGFGAWDQPDEYAVRILAEELSCRPCTVYGKGKCRRGDFACMNWLTPEKVYEQIVRLNIL